MNSVKTYEILKVSCSKETKVLSRSEAAKYKSAQSVAGLNPKFDVYKTTVDLIRSFLAGDENHKEIEAIVNSRVLNANTEHEDTNNKKLVSEIVSSLKDLEEQIVETKRANNPQQRLGASGYPRETSNTTHPLYHKDFVDPPAEIFQLPLVQKVTLAETSETDSREIEQKPVRERTEPILPNFPPIPPTKIENQPQSSKAISNKEKSQKIR